MKKIKIIILLTVFSVLFIDKTTYAETKTEASVNQSSTISSPLEGINLEIDNVWTTTEDENGEDVVSHYYDDLDLSIVDSNGDTVGGLYKFSNNLYSPLYGYNHITYTFTPFDKEKYSILKGSFTVKSNVEPYVKTYTDEIRLNLKMKYYRIEINGKSYDARIITNLEQNTEYTVVVYQKKNKYFEETKLMSKTVKTKTK